MSNASTFHGIDFANKKANHGECWLVDDGERLTATFGSPPAEAPTRVAVDCPMGTTLAFTRLLRGEVATNQTNDVFKSRATDRLLREVVSDYQVNREWQARSTDDRKRFPRKSFFNGGSHVQPAVGMVIVPELLAWLADRAGTETDARLSAMRNARLGDGPVVEAHPRLFLYSAIERLRQLRGRPLGVDEMDAVAGYKASRPDAQEAAKAHRSRVFELLKANSSWLGSNRRELHAADVPALVTTDHAFDAWLSALTAWAHEKGETWPWQEGKLEKAVVEVEGHILVLRTSEK